MFCVNCGKEIPDLWLEGVAEPKCPACGRVLYNVGALNKPRKKSSFLKCFFLALLFVVAILIIMPFFLGKKIDKGTKPISSNTQTEIPLKLVIWYVDDDMHYIRGKIYNSSSNTIRYAQIDFNLYNKEGALVDSVWTNIANIDPWGTWEFKVYSRIYLGDGRKVEPKGISYK